MQMARFEMQFEPFVRFGAARTDAPGKIRSPIGRQFFLTRGWFITNLVDSCVVAYGAPMIGTTTKKSGKYRSSRLVLILQEAWRTACRGGSL
jgi:hypothetical protein